MTRLRIADFAIEADAIVFDKDGTLIQVGPLWTGFVRQWLIGVTDATGRPDLLVELRAALGVADDGGLVPNGLAHSGTMVQAVDAAVAVLRRRGVDGAERIVLASGSESREFDPADIVAVGDIAKTIARLKAAGLGIAVATSDERAPTERQLDLLGVAGAVDVMVCADDTIEPKPSAEVLGRVADVLAVPADRIVMVGDSEVDMLAGRNGGAGACVGVTGGGGDPLGADVRVETIERLVID